MKTVEYIFEPSRLFLVWHNTEPNASHTRRVVGEIIKSDDDSVFRYLNDTEDFKAALKEGFIAFPAFAIDSKPTFEGSVDVFKRRLPPKNREDYAEYLSQYSLPTDFSGSTFSLLGYTGARLASDTFELCPDLSDAEAPLDLLFELSGIHHYVGSPSEIEIGAAVEFGEDPGNAHDLHAVKAIVNDKHIGFINRAMSKSFTQLMNKGKVTGEVIRVHQYRKKTRVIVLVKFR